jgi:hypothetical protein
MKVPAYNYSYLGSRGRKMASLSLARAKVLMPCLKNKIKTQGLAKLK